MDKNTWGGKCPTWNQFINESLVNEHSTALGYASAKKAYNEYDEKSVKKHYPNIANELTNGNVIFDENNITIVGTMQEKQDSLTLLYKIFDDREDGKKYFIKIIFPINEEEFNNNPEFVIGVGDNTPVDYVPDCLQEEDVFNALKDDINSSVEQEVIKNWKDLARSVKSHTLNMDKDYKKKDDDALYV